MTKKISNGPQPAIHEETNSIQSIQERIECVHECYFLRCVDLIVGLVKGDSLGIDQGSPSFRSVLETRQS